MKLLISAISLLGLCALADAQPDMRYPPARQSVGAALGAGWQLSPAGALEAYRRPRRSAGPDFEARRQGAAQALRGAGIFVDFQGDVAHLAGDAGDCDRVIMAAQQLAAIPGINDIVIDTTCRPRS